MSMTLPIYEKKGFSVSSGAVTKDENKAQHRRHSPAAALAQSSWRIQLCSPTAGDKNTALPPPAEPRRSKCMAFSGLYPRYPCYLLPSEDNQKDVTASGQVACSLISPHSFSELYWIQKISWKSISNTFIRTRSQETGKKTQGHRCIYSQKAEVAINQGSHFQVLLTTSKPKGQFNHSSWGDKNSNTIGGNQVCVEE